MGVAGTNEDIPTKMKRDVILLGASGYIISTLDARTTRKSKPWSASHRPSSSIPSLARFYWSRSSCIATRTTGVY